MDVLLPDEYNRNICIRSRTSACVMKAPGAWNIPMHELTGTPYSHRSQRIGYMACVVAMHIRSLISYGLYNVLIV